VTRTARLLRERAMVIFTAHEIKQAPFPVIALGHLVNSLANEDPMPEAPAQRN
jgi:hypothetical protein